MLSIKGVWSKTEMCSVHLREMLVLSKCGKSNLLLVCRRVNEICALIKAPQLGTQSTCMSNKTIMGLWLCPLSVSQLTSAPCNLNAVNLRPNGK